MTSWGAGYWRVFNVLVRVLGLVAVVSGAVFTVLGLMRILQLGFLRSEGSPPLVILLVGLLVGALGLAILRGPPYRPDLGDVSWRFDPFGAKTRQTTSPGRLWWTGDRRR
jgi:hypothetical protein